VWGKFYNAGQTCVAPDYVLAHKNVRQALLDQLGKTIEQFYGQAPAQSPDYARIINERHFDRLQALLSGGRVVFGGQTDREKKYIAPTVLTDVNLSHPLMQEEIFGPLLPVLEVADLAAAIRFVRERPKPLALYVFTNDAAHADTVLSRTSAGGAVVNDTIIHVAASTLPFGGVGGSGTGAYHGKASFDAFSHRKSVLKKPWFLDLKMRYPPYNPDLKSVRRLIG
jgi:acyl-CoA reductase-like NAD-dependent aldehyde dehydrogenase